MKLTVLGSAASEGIPAVFCACDFCREARKVGGKNIRRRTSYLIDDDTLIDYGPDINWALNTLIADPLAVKRAIFTHAHHDHCNITDIRSRGLFSQTKETMDFIADCAVFKRIADELPIERCSMNLIPIAPKETLELGDGMTITALRASHDPDSTPLNYFISRGGKTILIANDTGRWPEENWEFAASLGLHLDLAEIECTMGWSDEPLEKRWNGHLYCDTTLEFRDRLAAIGLLDERTIVFTNHFTHNAHLQNGAFATHENLEAFFNPHGILVGYDGMTLEF